MASLNLAVRLLVELAAVVWVGWWGATVSTETAPRVVVVVVVVVAVAGQPVLALGYAVLVLVNAAWILANEDAVTHAFERMGPRA